MKKILSIIFYILAIFLGIVFLMIEFNHNIIFEDIGMVLIFGFGCLFLYLGSLFLSKHYNNNKPMKINLWIFFSLYLILLTVLTLFSSSWGRNGFTFLSPFNKDFITYFKNSINLIPFKTIISFIKQFDSMYSSKTIFLNILGNFIALMPFAFFLPMLFESEKIFKKFIITIILIVLGIELIQLLTSSGRFDIDDFILNISGATLMYFLLKIKDINKLIRKIFLLEKNKISKKGLIIIIILVVIIFLGVFGLYQYRKRLYNNNLDEYYKLHYPDIKVVDEGDICKEELDLFYEDALFNYYFPCLKSDKVYVIVNSEEKYLLKDFLNGKTKYDYVLENVLLKLDDSKINYIKESKYENINFDVKVPIDKVGSYYSPDVNIKINDANILGVKYNFKDLDNANFKCFIYLIPKVSGKTTIDISVKDKDGNSLAFYKYDVTVDNDLNVKFEKIN